MSGSLLFPSLLLKCRKRSPVVGVALKRSVVPLLTMVATPSAKVMVFRMPVSLKTIVFLSLEQLYHAEKQHFGSREAAPEGGFLAVIRFGKAIARNQPSL